MFNNTEIEIGEREITPFDRGKPKSHDCQHMKMAILSDEYLTDGQRYRRFLQADVSLKSQSNTKKLTQNEFDEKYANRKPQDDAETTQESAIHQQNGGIRRSSVLVGERIGESSSFVERCRVIKRWATPQTISALQKDRISLAEAWKQSRKQKAIRLVATPKKAGVQQSLGEALAEFTYRHCSFSFDNQPGRTMSEDQKDLIIDIAYHLHRLEMIKEIELQSIECSCSRAGLRARQKQKFE